MRQRDIAPLPPEFCSAALVVPAKLPGEGEANEDTAKEIDETADTLSRAEIEAKAVDAVMERERSLG